MTAPDPLRVAVVGSGPAGFYAASNLLTNGAEVDMFERLPTPWGLVRLGVAPDHPNIKAVSRVFEKVAQRPGFRFFGNVEIGRHLSAEELRSHYHAVVWSVGAQVDRRMGIPGEDLPGSLSATAFVAWYNGHPDYADVQVDLDVDRIVVVGNGNVAVDCARMLALTREELAPTDTTDDAIEAIVSSRVKEIVILGRRGPLEAAYTTPELVELGALAGADVAVDPAEAAVEIPDDATTVQRRNVEIVREYAQRTPTGKPRVVRLRYLSSPVELRGDGRVQEMVIAHNRLEPGPDGTLRAVPTGETEVLECGLVLRSVGYRGTPLEGVPFDPQRAVIPNEGGRVAPGEYCSGWIKRGPSGIIGTNKKDANETAALVLEDAAAGLLPTPGDPSPEAIEALVLERQPHLVEYAGWEAIDAHERDRGQPHGRPRVKLRTWDELMALGRRS
ncbi:MAG: ferredoxin/flavodoxin---NADP+ reductase [Gaiellaceae bacterium]|nr:ferredoxin/flavodoxin---NADP+ reductase [Gaiellaceae bacterium]